MDARGTTNALFAAGWTAGMCSAALAYHAVFGDPSMVGRLTGPWARGLARTWGMQVRAFGVDGIDPGQPCLFMSNHASHVDIVALFVALPLQPGFLAKKELRRVPFFGRAMEVAGHVFIDRRNRSAAVRSLREAAKQVHEGRPLVIFPEGTRGDGQRIGSFKKGAIHLAKKADVPVVPVGIRGSAKVLPRNSSMIRGGPVEVHVGTPIPASEVNRLSADELMATVRSAISELSGLPLA